jgi:ubiquinone/menaquinone biosynthesis C-methylase UbiE
MLDYLKKKNPYIIGIGIDNMTEIKKKKWKDDLVFWWGDVLKNEIPSSSVDVVFAGYILQVLSADERGKLFEEIYRILTPGGTVVFLEVIDQGEERNAENERKHKLENPNTRYLVMSHEGWRDYINTYGLGLVVMEKAAVDNRSMAYRTVMNGAK